MEDVILKIPLMQVIEMIRKEQLQEVKDHLTEAYGKQTGDCMDTFVQKESQFLKMFSI